MNQKFNYKLLIILLITALGACNKIERISAVRITNVEMLSDSLSAIVYGEIIDSEVKAGSISDHGFCFTEGFADVKLGDANVDTLSLGPVEDENRLFSDTVVMELPNTTYYVRAYMIVDGNAVYGSPKLIKSRDFRVEDLNLGILSTVVAFGPMGSLTIKGFVNKKKIQTDPVTLIDFGTRVSFFPDSTAIGEEIVQLPTTDDIIYFSNPHTGSGLGTPPPSPDDESVYVWGFARYALNANPNDIKTIYTVRRRVRIKP